MNTLDWRTIAWQYGLPILILLSPIGLMIVTGADLGLVWLVILGPALAFLIGIIFRPRRLWVVPTAVATVLAMAIFIANSVGNIQGSDTGVTLLIRLLAGGALIVVLPHTFLILVGEALRETIDDVMRNHRGPQVPAT